MHKHYKQYTHGTYGKLILFIYCLRDILLAATYDCKVAAYVIPIPFCQRGIRRELYTDSHTYI